MFTFPVQTEEWFDERTTQFVSLGIPRRIVDRVRARVDDAWADRPGGWTFEWSAVADEQLRRGDPLLASLCFGAAKFPCLNTSARQVAYARQLESYLQASRGFKIESSRVTLDVPYRDTVTPVAAHIYRRRRRPLDAVLLLSGGVDTLKLDLHSAATMMAKRTGLVVAAIDMPGTGESRVPLAEDSDLIYAGVVEALRGELDISRVGMFALSFGGHWAAKLAIKGAVDAAVDVGGPIGAGAVTGAEALELPYGMAGIVANALRLDELPDAEGAAKAINTFSLGAQGLLDREPISPLLAVNGDRDQYIPQEDTLVFADWPRSTAWLVKGATHCAAERARPVFTAAVAWLVNQLQDGRGWRRRAWLTRRLIEPMIVTPSAASAAPAASAR